MLDESVMESTVLEAPAASAEPKVVSLVARGVLAMHPWGNHDPARLLGPVLFPLPTLLTSDRKCRVQIVTFFLLNSFLS